jgi:hypothetical protein
VLFSNFIFLTNSQKLYQIASAAGWQPVIDNQSLEK